jgi:DNA polymerase-3 subunit gamma/tau
MLPPCNIETAQNMKNAASSYLVISRRYRPQRFEQLIGQEALGKTLKNAVLQERTAHAYLFTGPRGVGKTSAARILAKALRCEKKEGENIPCNTCASCVEIQEGKAMDVTEIDAASNTGVDNIRELKESVSYMASSGQYRVFIIDEVHMLSTAAFNALLKTLEEPPPNVVFIFATTEIHKVPATILSRCQRFDFKKISSEKIFQWLKEICAAEKITADDSALSLITDESEGCMRDAQSLLDQAIALSGKNINREELEEVLGFIPRQGFYSLMDALVSGDFASSLNLASKAMAGGADPKILLGRLLATFRDLNFLKVTGVLKTTDEEYKNKLNEWAPKLTQNKILNCLDQCLQMQSQLTASIDAAVAIESLVIKLALPPDTNVESKTTAQSSLATPTPAKASPSTYKTPPAAPQVSAPTQSKTTENNNTPLVKKFQEFLRQHRPAWMPVMKSLQSMTEAGNNRMTVQAMGDFAGKRLASSDGQLVLKQCFGAEYQFDVQLSVTEKTKDSNKSPHEIAKEKLKNAKEDVAVQSALKAFKGVLSETKILDE